jgi:hypothetical protein
LAFIIYWIFIHLILKNYSKHNFKYLNYFSFGVLVSFLSIKNNENILLFLILAELTILFITLIQNIILYVIIRIILFPALYFIYIYIILMIKTFLWHLYKFDRKYIKKLKFYPYYWPIIVCPIDFYLLKKFKYIFIYYLLDSFF